jgi:hypothetical protein
MLPTDQLFRNDRSYTQAIRKGFGVKTNAPYERPGMEPVQKQTVPVRMKSLLSDPHVEQTKRDLAAKVRLQSTKCFASLSSGAEKLDYLPQMLHCKQLGGSSSIAVEPFTIRLRFTCNHPITDEDIVVASVGIEHAKNQEFLFKCELSFMQQFSIASQETTEDGIYNVSAAMRFDAIPEIELSDSTKAKSVCGRSDGMKNNVNKFHAKERILHVLLKQHDNFLHFKSPIVCVPTQSFSNALKTYSREVNKIQELFDFLTKFMLRSTMEFYPVAKNPPPYPSGLLSVPSDVSTHVEEAPQQLINIKSEELELHEVADNALQTVEERPTQTMEDMQLQIKNLQSEVAYWQEQATSYKAYAEKLILESFNKHQTS